MTRLSSTDAPSPSEYSIKGQIERGVTTVDTARTVTTIIFTAIIGALLLGISLGIWFF